MMSAQEILLRVKKNVFTQKSAEHLSKMRGDGLDFCEIRPYQAGDDIRKINFSASGKTGELQTNVFNEDRQINVVICVMLSSSLHFGSVRLKNELIAEIVAHLAYSSMQQKNQTKLVFFFNNEQQVFQLNNMGSLLAATEELLNFDLLKTQISPETLNAYLVQQAKSLVFVIGDFYQSSDYSMIAHKNQINAILVRDPLEEFPNFGTELSLKNAQNNSDIEADFDKRLAKKYQSQLKIEDDKRYSHFAQHKINVGKIYTNDDVFVKLSQILR
ncbi:hypothetical protein THERMOT_433 [Bathymodiolus thermophilus thioautotrophic gill symbiont]|uniref:DUF58 domain-containing protein n=1 Tax=Bathymodiolus thermophilus thioautotrophic gill symbiont TaxID=2360 RepID=A0A1J5UIG4_9GAMM|nr:DUF58 domain-containing protein [Bathymodiolus thermophilus thioautotrophic gill symbiont]AYQ56748.1 hypothetical protein MS2017_1039 [Bathymodiolus thermophilus thioautotrophic gill symbiont]OIR24063.1 hypothetical protein BGC33_09230 [Bathymodiolus thermophilus thioautotrophic gill symbiont]CAB5496019.1 hypothetical protein THERMOT_433 [Bathymodiolus thermophilus thioautotrophic gill symbiont]CAB5502548.1 hypothetical protein THERMOS_1624 [Bathymodiolus thermophilus thioautotrophic gill sy